MLICAECGEELTEENTHILSVGVGLCKECWFFRVRQAMEDLTMEDIATVCELLEGDDDAT